jgi:PBP1b-binding outer membrane lipoprotein LpoB
MKPSAVVTLLICLVMLAGCAAYPDTPEERERQDRAEQQRRIDAMNRGR